MTTVAYLSNLLPSQVEPYVVDEMEELRRRGIRVVACSARRVPHSKLSPAYRADICLQSVSARELSNALRLLWRKRRDVAQVLILALADTREPWLKRAKALVHTILGACLAAKLEPESVDHIHVHHGYFASWIGMVAARLLGINWSLTLHGSDLLLNPTFLDLKLRTCAAAFTVSEYNLGVLRNKYPESATKLRLRRLGTPPATQGPRRTREEKDRFVIVSAGRLHPVKNYGFLLDACAELKRQQTPFLCLIAGDGPERDRLSKQIEKLKLEHETKLVGHLHHDALVRLFAVADLFVLTSKSEGIPVVLMEAMARGLPVLAPLITGIPELVIPGRTGFLYQAGSLHDFVSHVQLIRETFNALGPLRDAARHHIQICFDRTRNLNTFISDLLSLIGATKESFHEDPVLQ